MGKYPMLTPKKKKKSEVVIPILHKVDFREKKEKKVTRDRGYNVYKHLQTPIIEPRYTTKLPWWLSGKESDC